MRLRPNGKSEARKKGYKTGVDEGEGRRRRAYYKELSLESIQSTVRGVWSNDPNSQLEATTEFRKLLSIERSPPIDDVIKAGVIPRFVEFLGRHDLPQLQFEAAWSLTNVASGTSEHTQVVIEHGAVPMFVQLLSSSSDDIREQFMIDNHVLPCLHRLLTQNPKRSIKKEACWTISNITAGNRAQIQAVIDADIVLPLVQLLQYGEYEIKKEAAWAISNAAVGGSQQQIRFLARQGCIRPLCDLLACTDPNIVMACMEGLESILRVGEADKQYGMNAGINLYAEMIDDCEGLDKLEHLQRHYNNQVYEKSVRILEKYWADEDEEQNIDGGFSFGNNQPNGADGGFNFG